MHLNCLVLLLPFMATWYLLCQLWSCWKLLWSCLRLLWSCWSSTAGIPCNEAERGLQNLVHSTTESWILAFDWRVAWHKFSKTEERQKEPPPFFYTCVKSFPIARLSSGAQPELIQLPPGWHTSVSFLPRFFRRAGRSRRTGAGAKGKFSLILSYPDLGWEHIRWLWISLGKASHSGRIPSSSPTQLPEASCLHGYVVYLRFSSPQLCVPAAQHQSCVKREVLVESGEPRDNPKLHSRESSSLGCCPKAKIAVCCSQLSLPKDM